MQEPRKGSPVSILVSTDQPVGIPNQPELSLEPRYAAYVLGTALTATGLTHYPGHHVVFGLVLAAGLLVVVGTALVSARRAGAGPADLLRSVLAAPLLAIGVGLVAGGIQTFDDHPVHAATLIPAGMVLAFLGHATRTAGQRRVARPAAVVAVLAVLAFAGLQSAAVGLPGAADHSGETGVAQHR